MPGLHPHKAQNEVCRPFLRKKLTNTLINCLYII